MSGLQQHEIAGRSGMEINATSSLVIATPETPTRRSLLVTKVFETLNATTDPENKAALAVLEAVFVQNGISTLDDELIELIRSNSDWDAFWPQFVAYLYADTARRSEVLRLGLLRINEPSFNFAQSFRRLYNSVMRLRNADTRPTTKRIARKNPDFDNTLLLQKIIALLGRKKSAVIKQDLANLITGNADPEVFAHSFADYLSIMDQSKWSKEYQTFLYSPTQGVDLEASFAHLKSHITTQESDSNL